MREIKFRARQKETNEWYYGSSSDNDSLALSRFWLQAEKGWLDANTVGEYVERHDENGKEIYQGDILQTTRGRETVAWESHGSGFYPFSVNPNITGKVIGNRYDNPELMEDGSCQ